jgi:hypothetical protein
MPRCGSTTSWVLKSRRRRCAKCRFDWRPGQLPLRLSRSQWRDLLQWFVRGATSAAIAHETGRTASVLRARTAVARAAGESPEQPPRFHHQSSDEGVRGRRGRAHARSLMTNGNAWAEVLSEADADTFERYVNGPRAGTGRAAESAPTAVISPAPVRLAAVPGVPAEAGPLEAFWRISSGTSDRQAAIAERLIVL